MKLSITLTCLLVTVCTSITTTNAFLPSTNLHHVSTTITTRSTTKSMAFLDDLLEKITPPKDLQSIIPKPPSPPTLQSNESNDLFTKAKAVVDTDLGLNNPSLLSDDFVWIGPNVASVGALNKEEYLAASSFFNLRSTFPDLDYRTYDYRIDASDEFTVRLTARTVGTMRGELKLRSGTIVPNGKRMVCPPEAISVTFDPLTGRVTKLCSGFCMDRLVGNTNGLCGAMAAATIAGEPPSEWEIYPPATVITRFFSRTVKQLDEPKELLAPFPESVMIQLAKGVLNSNIGTSDPDLLSKEFTFCAPIVGPIKKDEFIKAFGGFNLKGAFEDLEEGYSNFRVDPYDPYRVWVDAKGSGTRTGELLGNPPDGAKYVGPPEAASITFDDDGFCTRFTAGAAMDPSDCNTGGLGGVFGILYACGIPLNPLATRPLPEILARAQTVLLSPITGSDVDGFTKLSGVTTTAAAAPPVAAIPPSPPTPPTPKAPKAPVPQASSTPAPPTEEKSDILSKTISLSKTFNLFDDELDPESDTFTSFFGTKQEEGASASTTSTPVKKESDAKAKADAAKVQKEKVAQEKKAKAEALKLEKEKAAEEKKAKAEAAKAAKAEKVSASKQESAAAKAQAQEEAKQKRIAAQQEALARRKAQAEAAAVALKEKKEAAAAAKKAKAEAMKEQRESAKAKSKPTPVAVAPKKSSTFSLKKAAPKEQAPPATQKKSGFSFGKKETTPAPPKAEVKKSSTFSLRKPAPKETAPPTPPKKSGFTFGSKKEATPTPPKPAEKKKSGFSFGGKKEKTPAPPKVEVKKSPTFTLQRSKTLTLKPTKATPPPPKKAAPAPKKAAVAKAPTSKNPPAGVPVLTRWRKNRDGSLTGFITGSAAFEKNEKVTTSPIASGDFKSNSVVVTASGSKYFLR